jgi:hypothetical protein
MLDPYIAKSRARFVRRPYAPPSSHTAAAAKKAAAAAAAAAATAARPAPPQGVRRSRRGAWEEEGGGGGRLSQVAEDGEDDGPGEVTAPLCRACTCELTAMAARLGLPSALALRGVGGPWACARACPAAPRMAARSRAVPASPASPAWEARPSMRDADSDSDRDSGARAPDARP